MANSTVWHTLDVVFNLILLQIANMIRHLLKNYLKVKSFMKLAVLMHT